MNALLKILFLPVLALLFAAPAAAQPLASGVQWKDPAEVDLEVDFPGQGYSARWQLFRCDCGDLLIRSELAEPGEAVHGDIVLVGNRAVLTRGFGDDAAELASVDAPALMMQLALRLLQRIEPAGPPAVTERREVSVEDAINPIHLDTGAAAGGFPAPWSVTGAIWPAGDTERRFDLVFEFDTGGVPGAEGGEGRMRIAGTAEYARAPFPLEPGMELGDWTLGWRDPEDPLADEADMPATLADLRKLVRNNPY